MLKFILRYSVLKNLVPLLLILALFIGFKVIMIHNLDTEITDEINKIAVQTAGMNYEEAKAFTDAEVARLLQDAVDNHTGEVRDYFAERAAQIGSELDNRLRILRQAEENIENAKNGSGISYGIPSDYYAENITAYTRLDPPSLVGGSWYAFESLQLANPVVILIFLLTGVIYIRDFEQRIYLSNFVTKNGRKYALCRFVAFMLISCLFTAVNFIIDIFASKAVFSADIFTTQIQGISAAFADSFVNCTIFQYLLFTLFFQLLTAINMFDLFFLAARAAKDTYGFAVAGVSAILFLVIIRTVFPFFGSFLSVGFPDVSLQFTAALDFGGYTSIMPVMGVNVILTAVLTIFTKRKAV